MRLNIADRLRTAAANWPHQRAVVFPEHRDGAGRTAWTHLTFEELDREADRLARGLVATGMPPGARIVLAVRPSLEFIALTFALFRAGAVVVLIDPGMGVKKVLKCLGDVNPDGFVAFPAVQAVRTLSRRRFPNARFNVTVGRRLFWGGPTYKTLLGGEWTPFEAVPTNATDPAAIIFTSGSTGPAKGVLYEHGMFDAQVDLLREFYGIAPGEIDLPGFPLFALFNSAMGVTTVVPDMDPTKPAQVDPAKIVAAIRSQGVTQAFGSPAIWNRVGRYCERERITLPSLRRVLSAGAPVPVHVVERMRQTLVGDADLHTPYGATESLPIASISGREVLEDSAEKSRTGAGTCVGWLFPGVEVKIVEITEGPLDSLTDAVQLPTGEIGEILVRSPSTTREYVDRPEPTRLAKVPDGDGFWHRMGDVGYLDERGRLWFCGRKAHVVETATGRMFSVRCEAVFNEHPAVYRTALVGVPAGEGYSRPVIVVEPEDGRFPKTAAERERFRAELRALAEANPLTVIIEDFLFHRAFPVDVRHNIKINREELAQWAATQLPPQSRRAGSRQRPETHGRNLPKIKTE